MSKHTKEPWTVDHIHDHEGCGCCTESFCDEDIKRIVACVNALAGIENPGEWVKNAKYTIPLDMARNPEKYFSPLEES